MRRVELPNQAVQRGVGARLRVRMPRNRGLARRAVDALLLECGLPHLGDGGRGVGFVLEPQHRVDQHLLALLGAGRCEPVDEVVPACHSPDLGGTDRRDVRGGREYHCAEAERAGQRRVDLPRPDDVVGHALGFNDDAPRRIARHPERLTWLGRVGTDIELVWIDCRLWSCTLGFHRCAVDDRGARRRHQRRCENEREKCGSHLQKTTAPDTKCDAGLPNALVVWSN